MKRASSMSSYICKFHQEDPMIELPGPGKMEYYNQACNAFVEYEGKGILVLDNYTELKCEFKTGQFTNGNIVLICNILPISIHEIIIDNWEKKPIRANYLRGRTMDGLSFEAVEVNFAHSWGVNENPPVVCFIFTPKEIRIGTLSDLPMDTISFGITNFLFTGMPYETPGFIEYINLNKILGRNIALWKVKDYNEISQFMKIIGEQHITCEIVADLANSRDIQTIESMIHNLCYVLSAGSGSKVQWIFYRIFSKNLPIYVRHIQVPIKPYNSQTIIDAEKDMQNWIKFVNNAYQCFILAISRFGMINNIPRIMAAIDVFTDSRIFTDFTQTKGIKLAITMEMIKEMFKTAWMPETKLLKGKASKNMEKEIKEALEPILRQYLPEEEAKSILGTVYQLNKVSFETILRKGFEQINFNPDPEELKLFIMNRDSLVHQGRFYSETASDDQKARCKPLSGSEDDYTFVSNFLSRVFHALLGYKGRQRELYAIEPLPKNKTENPAPMELQPEVHLDGDH